MRSTISAARLLPLLLALPIGEVEQRTSQTPGVFLEATKQAPLQPTETSRVVTAVGLILTETSEGWVDHLYDDAAGYCTIGYGHLVEKQRCSGSEPQEFLKGITQVMGATLLQQDMSEAELAVSRQTKGIELTAGEFDALADFVYNVGPSNFARSTVLRLINGQRPDLVPAQLRLWVQIPGPHNTHVVLQALVTRRENEIAIFCGGSRVCEPKASSAHGGAHKPPFDLKTDLIDIRRGE